MNEIKVEAKGITLYIKDPTDWPIAERITGSMKSKTPGVFECTRSATNLTRIYTVFGGSKRPVLRGGTFFIDQERERLRNYMRWTDGLVGVAAQERVPIEPNGMFIPFAHQTKLVMAPEVHPFSAGFSDCGTGKTGSYARAIEIALAKGEVMRGKVLVSAPLSILGTSWMDDIQKFTALKAGVLRSKIQNKDILGEAEVIADYGPKPSDSVSVKKKSQVRWKNKRTNQILPKLTALEKVQADDWVKYQADIRYSFNLNGEATPFGEVVGYTSAKGTEKIEWFKSMLADPKYDLFLINHDGVKIYEDLLKEHNFAWVLVDESTKIKNARASVTQAHTDISWRCKRRTILTGTPNPNGYDDLWSQFYFLDRGLTLEASVADFHAEYFKAIRMGRPGEVKWVLRSKEDRDRLINRVKRSAIFIEQRDCIDLPPRLNTKRLAYMTGEQERVYMEMEENLVTELMDMKSKRRIRAEAVNILSKTMKLRQITSGYLVGEEGTKGKFDTSPKLSDLDAFIDELGGKKLVVACQFKEEIFTLLERYKDLGVAAIYGGVPDTKRDDSIRDFQNTDKLQLMILQPQAASHGITLTAASYLFFLSLDYNFEYYYQVAKRIERLGQKNNMVVAHSLAVLSDGSPTIDHDVMDVLAAKGRERSTLFDSGKDMGDLVAELTDRLIKRVESRV